MSQPTDDTAAARLRAVVSRMTPAPWTPGSYHGGDGMTDLSEGDEVLVHGAQPLSEVFCDVCSEDQGRRIRVDGVFTDSVTGRSFCTECAGAYISWLLDGGVVDHPELREVYEGSDDG